MGLTLPGDAIEATFGQLRIVIGLDEVLVLGPAAGSNAREIPGTPEAVREHLRHTDEGRFRPLSGAKDMPTGWFARVATLDALSDVLDAAYPLAQRHTEEQAEGSLRVVSLDDVLGRQQGRYASAVRLSERGRERARALLCGFCVRTPVWAGERLPDEGGIPCPEACSVMVSLCREATEWELDRPTMDAPDPAVAFAAFETAGNIVREAYLRGMEHDDGQ